MFKILYGNSYYFCNFYLISENWETYDNIFVYGVVPLFPKQNNKALIKLSIFLTPAIFKVCIIRLVHK